MSIELRAMERRDWAEVADLIYVSTNYWYRANGRAAIFTGDPICTQLFPSVYEALDPGCCILGMDERTGRIAGSCFYHPRPTHVALGIMNVHPNYFGQGVARRLLGFVIECAERAGKPVRLVSSAMNLDSFSLYTRAGFVPRCAYQDMYVPDPVQLTPHDAIRSATLADVPVMAALELELNSISREQDYRYFVENRDGIWHVSVWENERGALDGFLVSVAHPGCNMLGPGISRTAAQAAALIEAELVHHQGRTPVFLVPVDCTELVRRMYAIGARNCELHFAQVRGAWQAPTGVVMPTFMPETG